MRTATVENVVDKRVSAVGEAAWNLRLDKVLKKTAKSVRTEEVTTGRPVLDRRCGDNARAMAHILILYSTTDGHTLKICQRLQRVIEQEGHRVTLKCLDEDSGLEIGAYDKVVVGARIRYGKHTPQLFEFGRAQRAALDAKPNAFFTVNVVARKPEKNTPATNPYMRKFLARSAWQPRTLGVFAGRINYARYRFWDRQVIRFIMWLTKGPTDPATDVEFTDWAQVDAFGRTVARM